MAATPSLLVAYTVPDRDGIKTVTNRHHFLGGTPADIAAWHTLMDNVVADFKDCISTEAEIIRCDGYAAGSDVAITEKAYTQSGSVTIGDTGKCSTRGFECGLIRWSTDQKTSKNHPIYLFAYIHGMVTGGVSGTDAQQINGGQVSVLQDFASTWISPGYSDGTNSYTRAGPNGAAAIDFFVDNYLRDHDLSPR